LLLPGLLIEFQRAGWSGDFKSADLSGLSWCCVLPDHDDDGRVVGCLFIRRILRFFLSRIRAALPADMARSIEQRRTRFMGLFWFEDETPYFGF